MPSLSYYRDDYLAGNCPAGLVRTEQGCQSQRLWALGEPLDPAVTYEILPQPLLGQLDPIPDSYSYIRLGEHVLLMSVELADHSRRGRQSGPAAARAACGRRHGAWRRRGARARRGYRGGGCPPGLAKKNNGCLPPGHAK